MGSDEIEKMEVNLDTDENVNREELEKRDDPAVSAALNKKKKRRNNNNKRGGKNCCSGTIIQKYLEKQYCQH